MRRGPVVTGGIFVVLLAVTWWVVEKSGDPEPSVFFSLKHPIPDTLIVVYGPDTTVVVPRGETGWQVIHPVDYPADGVVIRSMTKHLSALEVQGIYPFTPEKIDTYGFRFPRAMIRASYREGLDPDTLFIGGFTPNAAFDYIRNGNGADVALLASRISRGNFLKRTSELRDTKLMPFHEADASEITLRGPGGTVQVVVRRDPTEGWEVVVPYPGPADQKKTREYLRSVNHMHIQEFAPDDETPLAVYGLHQPVAGIRITTTRGADFGFDLGGSAGVGQQYAVSLRRPEVFIVSTKYLPVLEWPDHAFRQTTPFGFGLSSVEAIGVANGSGEVTFSLSEDAAGTPAPDGMREALGNWIGLLAKAFDQATPAALKQSGLAPPQGTLVWLGGGDTLAVVDVGPVQNDRIPLRISSGTSARKSEILWVSEVMATPLWSYFQVRLDAVQNQGP